MKKVLFSILACTVLMLGLTGCGTNNNFEVGEVSDKEILQSDVSLLVKDSTLKNTGATFVITNNGEEKILYGNDYELEIKKDDEWHKINLVLDFNMIGYSLDSKESKDFDID